VQIKSLALKAKLIGALPIVDAVMQKLELRSLLTAALGRETYVDAVELLIKSILVEPNALYRIREWSAHYEPSLVYGAKLGDDTIARALDRLFEADRASLMTRLIVTAVKVFGLDTQQIHNDSTSVKFCGAYAHQKKNAVNLKRGHSKDHRPDLLQLVYSLSVTADGCVPVHFKAYDGNQNDDGTHWETWQTLRGLLGRSDFLYTADSKLCVSKTLLNIDRAQGRFVTIVPRTRTEVADFSDRVVACAVRWERLYTKRSSRRHKRIDVFECAQELYQMREGFRLYWYRSSEKVLRDEQDRVERLAAAVDRLKQLNAPSRRGPKTEAALRKAATKIVQRYRVEAFVGVGIERQPVEKFRQTKPGKPSKNTVYRRHVKQVIQLTWTLDQQAINQATAMDGIFPLATNTDLSALDVLKTYKYQPRLEKRHSLFKSVLEISPVFLKRNDRVDALVFTYFIAQCIAALIERTVRKQMEIEHVDSLPILPEGRPSKLPSAGQILSVFAHRQKHELTHRGAAVKTFADPLTPAQAKLLKMLGVSPKNYQ